MTFMRYIIFKSPQQYLPIVFPDCVEFDAMLHCAPRMKGFEFEVFSAGKVEINSITFVPVFGSDESAPVKSRKQDLRHLTAIFNNADQFYYNRG